MFRGFHMVFPLNWSGDGRSDLLRKILCSGLKYSNHSSKPQKVGKTNLCKCVFSHIFLICIFFINLGARSKGQEVVNLHGYFLICSLQMRSGGTAALKMPTQECKAGRTGCARRKSRPASVRFVRLDTIRYRSQI